MNWNEILTGITITIASAFAISAIKSIYSSVKKISSNNSGLIILITDLICLIIASINLNIDILIRNFFSKANVLNCINLLTIIISFFTAVFVFIKDPYKTNNTN